MLTVALTGGIGSGKSSVSKRFEALGVPVIDADVLSRELVSPGAPALQEIARQLGPELIRPDGSLDRAALRNRIFDDPRQRRQLEEILHPRILAGMQQRLATLEAPYAVLVIPLLLEAGQARLADRILVVDCPVESQMARVRQRDGLSAVQVERILAAQASREARLAMADDVIDNSGSLAALTGAVDRQHQAYLQLARAGRPLGSRPGQLHRPSRPDKR